MKALVNMVLETIKSDLVGWNEIIEILEGIVDKMKSEHPERGSAYTILQDSLEKAIEESKK